MLQRFAVADIEPAPWTNGTGRMREIARWPQGAAPGGFDWCAGVADIEGSGSFPVDPGIGRSIVLLQGEGLRLRGGLIDHWLDRPPQPFGFDGEVALGDTPLHGASSVF